MFEQCESGRLFPIEVDHLRPRVEGLDMDHQFSAEELEVIGGGVHIDGNLIEKTAVLDECVVGFPGLGMADRLGGSPYAQFYCYKARRQFRKSLNRALIQSDIPHLRAAQDYLGERRGLMGNAQILDIYQAVNRMYAPLGECYDSIMSGNAASRAITRNFAIAATYKSEHPLLVYKRTDVGYMDGQSICIHSDFSDLCEEFEEEAQQGVVIYE